MRHLRLLGAVAVICYATIALPQSIPTEPGLKPYGSFHGGDIDLVNLRDGGLNLRIPLTSWPQRGGQLHVGFFIGLNDASIVVTPDTRSSPCDRGCGKDFGPGIADGIVVYPDFLPSVQWSGPVKTTSGTFSGQPAGISDGMGTTHSFFNLYNAESGAGNPQPAFNTPIAALDGSGYAMTLLAGSCPAMSSYASAMVQDRQGVRYTYPTSCVNPLNVSIEDPNGNQMMVNNVQLGSLYNVVIPNDPAPGTPTITDSMGRSIVAPPGPDGGSAGGQPGLGQPNGLIVPAAFATPGPTTSTSGCTGSPTATSAQFWTVPGPSGGNETFKFCFTQIYINISSYSGCSFQNTGVADANCFVDYGPYTRLSSIVLPDGSAWGFTYDSAPANSSSAAGAPMQIGDLIGITLPTGGTISYTWGGWQGTDSAHRKGGVTTRTVNANDGTGSHQWTYNGVGSQSQNANGTLNPTQVVTIVTDPLGNISSHTLVDLSGALSLYETLTQYEDPSGNILKTVQTTYSEATTTASGITFGGAMNVFPLSITTALDNGLVATTQKDYDFNPAGNYGGVSFGTVTANRDYDYGVGSPGPLLRQTVNSYAWQSQGLSNPSSPCPYTTQANSKGSAYQANNIIDAPTLVQVQDGNCNLVAQTAYGHDESALVSSGISTQHDSSPPAGSARGNQTSIRKWLNTSGAFLPTTQTFYDTGMVAQVTDPLGNTTTHSYDPAYAGAYSTQTKNALGQVVSGTYDFNTGLITSFTDANGSSQASGNTPGDPAHTTTLQYNDPLGRITQIQSPGDPSGNHPTITFQYPNPTTVQRSKTVTTGLTDTSTDYFDGLGRPSQFVHNSAGNATVVTTYDADGRKGTVTNPYVSTSDPTYGVTSMQYDALGRATLIMKQDGSITSAQYDQTSSTSLNGDCTISADEAGKSRKNCLDGLGRLIEVDEPQASSGSLSNPYVTLYSYDALGNLLSVNQTGDGSQTARMRKFTYDSVSRLLTATNPESGVISYSYDANSNVLQKTSPAPNQTGTATQTISYCYDPLNRVIGKAYAAQSCPLSSPVVSYGYDAGANGIGHLTSLSDQAGSGSYSYDALGRITTEQRTIAGIQKALGYGYNLDNSISTLTYPSGAVVTYTPDSAGRMLSAVDNANNINYVTGASYGPDNSLTGFTSGAAGSFAGIANSFSYNPRLQPVNMSAVSPGTSGTSATASVTIGGSLATASSTTGTPPPNAASGSALTGYEDSSFVNHWIYEGSNQHLYEFSWNSSSGGSSYLDATAEAGSVLAASNSALSNYLDTNQNPHWVYEDGSQNLQFLAYEVQGRTWLSLDVNSLAGSPVAASASPLTSKEDSNCQQEWAYFGSNQHLVEAYAVGNGSTGCLGNDVWNFSDGTAASNAPVPANGSALNVYFNTNQIPEWIYEDNNQHVQLLVHEPSGSWFNLDLTSTAGSPVAVPGSALASLEDSNCMQHWAYFGANQHLYQIHAQGNAGGGCAGNDVWSYSDATTTSGAPAAAAGSALSMYFDGNQNPHWSYEDSNHHIQLLALNNSSGTWVNVDVTQVSGAPIAAGGSALGSYEDSNCMQHWFYLGSNQHLYEIHGQGSSGCSGGEVWGYTDITAATSGITLDSGTVSLSVGGFTATVCFGSSSNPACTGQAVNTTTAQVATALAQALNASNSPVTASVSGSTITLAGKNNVVFDAGIDALNTVHDNPSLFPNPSFTSPATGFTGGSSASLPVFNITYNFNLGNGDNGNVIGITNNRDNTRSQSFTYDALNRLTSAQNAGTNCSATTPAGAPEYWGNSYGYDAWGNLLSKTVTKCSAENLSVTALANNQLSGYGYDAAGNMTHDATTNNSYTFDAENRITGAAGYSYTYDADGNRVEKSNGSTGTIYWYMTPGIMAESDLSGNLKSEYVFFGGDRVARKDFPTGAVSYYFSDDLKTASVITNSSGIIAEDEDFYPWGGEVQFVNSDSNHYKFGGHERDSETGLDYMLARYYSNPLGRFLTPDWAAKPITVPYANFGNPQSLNLYIYGKNNPRTFGDPDGHDPRDDGYRNPAIVATGPILIDPDAIISGIESAAKGFWNFMTSGPPSPSMLNPLPPPPCECNVPTNNQNTDKKETNNNSKSENANGEQGGASRTDHGQERADQARAGDAHREVGDANRTVQEGKQYTDTETGHNVSVRGNRVVVTDKDGNIVSQFKNTRANTNQRVQDGRWVPKPKPKPKPEEQK